MDLARRRGPVPPHLLASAASATPGRSTPTPPASCSSGSAGSPGCCGSSPACRSPTRPRWSSGAATTTLDASGEVTGTWDMSGVTLAEVRKAAASLTGVIDQVPPMVSAAQGGGRRLHELARAGIEVERAARPVHGRPLRRGPSPGRRGRRVPHRGRLLDRDLRPRPRRGPRARRSVAVPTCATCGAPASARSVSTRPTRSTRSTGAHVLTPGPGAARPAPGRARRRDGALGLARARPRQGVGGGDRRRAVGAARPTRPAAGRLRGDRDRSHGGGVRAGRQRMIADAATAVGAGGVTSRPRTGTGNLVSVEVVDGPEHCTRPPGGSAVTIGAYDGVHLGHRHLLGELRRHGRGTRGSASVVVTFDRHPATVVRPESAPLDPDRSRPEARAPGRGGHRPHAGGPLRPGPGQRDGRGLRARGPRAGPRAPGWWWWGRTSTSVTAARATWRCSPRWARGTDSRWSGSASRQDGSGAGRCRRRASAGSLAPCDVAGAAELLGRPHQVRGVGGARRRPGRRRARLPDGQRGRPRGRGHARRGDLRLLVRAARRVGPRRARPRSAGARRSTPPPSARARGVPAGLRRRPLRRGGPGVVRDAIFATSVASTPPRRSCAR